MNDFIKKNNDNELPLVSFCIFTYNQEKYIKECIESVLNNIKYENLEVIISDDHSNDRTYDIITETVQEHYTKHKLILNRNEINEGIGAHCAKIFSDLSSGDFIINLGGDDMVKEDYIQEILRYFNDDSNLMMVDLNGEIIDENGIKKNDILIDFDQKLMCLDDYIHVKPIYSFAPGRMFRRTLIDDFERISKDCPSEDKVLIVRSLLKGSLLRLNRNVIKYRLHTTNSSSLEGLKKISHEKIIDQFRRDILTAYIKGFINNEIKNKLLKRIKLDLELRNSIRYNRLKRLILNRIRLTLYRIERVLSI